jgi:hypothetical protein
LSLQLHCHHHHHHHQGHENEQRTCECKFNANRHIPRVGSAGSSLILDFAQIAVSHSAFAIVILLTQAASCQCRTASAKHITCKCICILLDFTLYVAFDFIFICYLNIAYKQDYKYMGGLCATLHVALVLSLSATRSATVTVIQAGPEHVNMPTLYNPRFVVYEILICW